MRDEKVAVRTLNNYLPYTPKIWHRPCFEAQQREAAARSTGPRVPVPAT